MSTSEERGTGGNRKKGYQGQISSKHGGEEHWGGK